MRTAFPGSRILASLIGQMAIALIAIVGCNGDKDATVIPPALAADASAAGDARASSMDASADVVTLPRNDAAAPPATVPPTMVDPPSATAPHVANVWAV